MEIAFKWPDYEVCKILNILRTSKSNKMENSGNKKTIEQIYQKKTQLEHILLRPDTYIGSVERQRQHLWVLDQTTKEMVYREISYVPGLYKIYGKIIIQCQNEARHYLS